MQELYNKSLQMIKVLDIKNEREYKRLLNNYLILNIVSLKYISQRKKFKDIVEIAKEA